MFHNSCFPTVQHSSALTTSWNWKRCSAAGLWGEECCPVLLWVCFVLFQYHDGPQKMAVSLHGRAVICCCGGQWLLDVFLFICSAFHDRTFPVRGNLCWFSALSVVHKDFSRFLESLVILLCPCNFTLWNIILKLFHNWMHMSHKDRDTLCRRQKAKIFLKHESEPSLLSF